VNAVQMIEFIFTYPIVCTPQAKKRFAILQKTACWQHYFYIARIEISQIGENVFFAGFVDHLVWGRESKAPILPVYVSMV